MNPPRVLDRLRSALVVRCSSLRVRVALGVGAVLVPALFGLCFLARELLDEQRDASLRHLRAVLGIGATAVGHQVDLASQALSLLAADADTAAGGARACAAVDRVALASLLDNVGLADAAGTVQCVAHPAGVALSFARRAWFRAALDAPAGTPVLTVEAQDGRPLAFVALALGRDGGVAFARIDLSALLGRNLAGQQLPRGAALAFAGPHLSLASDEENMRGWRPLADAVPQAARAGKTVSQAGTVWTGVPLAGPGGRPVAVLALSVPEDELGVPTSTLRMTLLALGMSGLPALFLTWLGYRVFVFRRLDRLVEVARRIGAHDWRVLAEPMPRGGEFGTLADTLRTMGGAVRQREREIAFRQFALDQHAIMSMTDANGTIVQVNERFCETSGYSAAELLGQNHRILNSGLHPAGFFRDMWDTISGGAVWHGVIRNVRKDGAFYWVKSSIVPRLDESGRPAGYMSIRTDVTALVHAEQARRTSEAMYRLLAENTQDIVSLIEPNGKVSYVSPACARVLGYDSLRSIGRDPLDLVHPDDRADVMRVLVQPLRDGAPCANAVFRIRHAGGQYVWMETVASAVREPDGRLAHIQYSLRDISLRHEAEEQLRLRDLAVQSSLTGILLLDAGPGHPVAYANPAFETLTGCRLSLLRGLPARRALERLEGADAVEDMLGGMADGADRRTLLRMRRFDGAWRWIDCAVAPAHGVGRSITHFVIALNDMTERMLVIEELQRARDQAEQASRAKTEFLSRATHELRTPLNFILGFAQLLLARPDNLSPSQVDGVRRIVDSGWHLSSLIDSVLDMSRIEAGRLELEPALVQLEPLIRECLHVVELAAAERALQLSLAAAEGGAAAAWADPLRLKEILLNLLSNAVKYSAEGAAIQVRCTGGAPGRVRIEVADQGPGIPPEQIGDLFRPFSRLAADRARVPGSGVGLAISQQLATLMGGAIQVASVPGQGSTFTVELPEAPPAGAPATIPT
ncbi:MAG TPA: PAS domain S-box protein [Telluria sp.]|nr:PAS domain S-box protein [Telluria sp.]